MKKLESFQTFRIFISSSFKDMHEERDYLNSFIFPQLDSWLTSWGWRLQVMDLRGTTAEPSDNMEEAILKMCLSGVEYCRPYFIGLIGDRYGWVPEGKQSEDALQSICKGFETIQYDELLGKSATHMEIYYAMKLLERDKCFFYFRNIKNLPKEEYQSGYDKQLKLKEDIKKAMAEIAPNNLKEYQVTDMSNRSKDLMVLGEMILSDLKSSIEEELKHAEDMTLNLSDQIAFYFNKKYENSVPMEDIRYIQNFLEDKDKSGVLMVTGEEGCGKSTLAARCVHEFQNQDALIISYYGGIGPDTFGIGDMLEYIKSVLQDYIEENHVDITIDSTSPVVYEYDHFDKLLYSVSKHIPVVLLLDGLGNMEYTKENLEFLWMDPQLPPRVKIVVFVPNRDFYMSWPHHILTLDYKEHENFLQSVMESSAAKRFKRFDKEILALAFAKAKQVGTPLYASIITDYLMGMTGENYKSHTEEDAHLRWMKESIQTMPTDLTESYGLLLNRAKEAFGSTVLEIFDLIAASEIGIREVDLQHGFQYLMEKKETRESILEEIQLGGDALLLSLRGFLSDHLNPFAFNGFWQFEHHALKKLILKRLKENHRYQIVAESLVKSMEWLPESDVFKKHGFILYCFHGERGTALLPTIANHSPVMEDELWYPQMEKILSTYPQKGSLWILSILAEIKEKVSEHNIYSDFFKTIFQIRERANNATFSTEEILRITQYTCEVIEFLPKTEKNALLLLFAYREYLETCILAFGENLIKEPMEKLVYLGEQIVSQIESNTSSLCQNEKAQVYCMLAFGYAHKACREICIDQKEPYNYGINKAFQLLHLYKEIKGEYFYYLELHQLLSIYLDALERKSFFVGISQYEKMISLKHSILHAIQNSFGKVKMDKEIQIKSLEMLTFFEARVGNSYLVTGNAPMSIFYYEKVKNDYEIYLGQMAISSKIMSEYGDRLLDYSEALIVNGDIKKALTVLKEAAGHYRQIVRKNPDSRGIIFLTRLLKYIYIFTDDFLENKQRELEEIKSLNRYGFVDLLGNNPYVIIASHSLCKIIKWQDTKSITGRIPALGTVGILKDMSKLWGFSWDKIQQEEALEEIPLSSYSLWLQERLLEITKSNENKIQVHWYLAGAYALVEQLESMMEEDTTDDYVKLAKNTYQDLRSLAVEGMIEKQSFGGHVFAGFGYFFMNNEEIDLAEECWRFAVMEANRGGKLEFSVINEMKRARGLINLGIIEEDYGEVKKALEYYEEARIGLEKILHIRTQEKASEELAFIHYSKAKILFYEELGEEKEIMQHLDTATILIENTGYLEDEKKLELLYDILILYLEVSVEKERWDRADGVIGFLDEIMEPLEEKEILDPDFQRELKKLVQNAFFSSPDQGEEISWEWKEDVGKILEFLQEEE